VSALDDCATKKKLYEEIADELIDIEFAHSPHDTESGDGRALLRRLLGNLENFRKKLELKRLRVIDEERHELEAMAELYGQGPEAPDR
jgi:hypothetical protein